jgi:transcriptional regulator
LIQIIETFPLATLISGIDDTNDISLVPLLVAKGANGALSLIGHVDKNNPQARRLVPDENVAFVFNGPDSYASPDIYDDAQLPGWLYVMVKGTGTIRRTIEGLDAIDMLCDASARFGGADQSFSLQNDDPRFAQFIGGISGFEIEVSELIGIAKLAQDKGPLHAKRASSFLAGEMGKGVPAFLEQMLEVSGQAEN